MSRTDTDRLNWLETRNEPRLLVDYETGEWGVAEYTGNINDREFRWIEECAHPTMREAIDAAIEKTTPAQDDRFQSGGSSQAFKALMHSIQGEVERRIKAYFSDEWVALRVPRGCVPAGAELAECYETEKEWVVIGVPDDPERHDCDQMGCSSLAHVVARIPRQPKVNAFTSANLDGQRADWLRACDELWSRGYGQLDQMTNETPLGSMLRLAAQGSPDPSHFILPLTESEKSALLVELNIQLRQHPQIPLDPDHVHNRLWRKLTGRDHDKCRGFQKQEGGAK